jgi:hypothetical protein
MMTLAPVHSPRIRRLAEFLARIPAVDADDSTSAGMSSGEDDGRWWIRFRIDVDDDLAWETIEALAYAVNGPGEATTFRPVSAVGEAADGPEESLFWVLEAPAASDPDHVASRLEAALPFPVDDLSAWGELEDEDDDDDDEEDDLEDAASAGDDDDDEDR